MKIMICAIYSDVNDYVRLLTEAYIRAGHTVVLGPQNLLYSNFVPDIVHLHWPEQFYKTHNYIEPDVESLRRLEDRIAWFKAQNAFIVYTVHNLAPHETSNIEFERQVYKLFARNADISIHHGAASVTAQKESFPDCAKNIHLVAPHGAYEWTEYKREDAMKEYGIPSGKAILLNFGLQRRYKGASFINEVFAHLNRKEFYLLTIGPLSPKPRKQIQIYKYALLTTFNKMLAPLVRRYLSHNRIWKHVPNDEIPRIMACTDVVILGHQSGLNSGLLALAASYAKAVVYPEIGNFREQLQGWPWAESYQAGNASSAAEAVKRIVVRWSNVSAMQVRSDHVKWLSLHSWDSHVKTVTDFVVKGTAQRALQSGNG